MGLSGACVWRAIHRRRLDLYNWAGAIYFGGNGTASNLATTPTFNFHRTLLTNLQFHFAGHFPTTEINILKKKIVLFYK